MPSIPNVLVALSTASRPVRSVTKYVPRVPSCHSFGTIEDNNEVEPVTRDHCDILFSKGPWCISFAGMSWLLIVLNTIFTLRARQFEPEALCLAGACSSVFFAACCCHDFTHCPCSTFVICYASTFPAPLAALVVAACTLSCPSAWLSAWWGKLQVLA